MGNIRFLTKRMLPISWALLLGAGLLALAGPPTQAQQPLAPIHANEQVVDTQPAQPKNSVALASGVLRAAVQRLRQGQTTGLGVDVVGSKIRVEVLHSLDSSEIRNVIAAFGGAVEGEVEGVLVEALVPFNRLEALESHAGVQFVRPPVEANVPIQPPSGDTAVPQATGSVIGEEVAKTNADDWHAAGYTGVGVKVGIIDYFDGTLWNNAFAAGEVPTPAGTFCQVSGASCDIWTIAAGEQHGQAVAEVVHEMAPGAQLYLATVDTTADMQAAVNYFVAQGVDIISRSLTAQYDGPGNGTGPIADVINSAVANGIVWFNSAGNNAGSGSYLGSYWRGAWTDTDADGWLDFAPGDERMGFVCRYMNGLRWSDFGAAGATDYDLYVFDNERDRRPISGSEDSQTLGAPPLELSALCNPGGTGVDYLAIHLYDPGNGTAGDVLEFMTNGGGLEYWQNPYSATGPASDTASPGALSIGAVDPALGTSIAFYSSRGPTNDALYGGTARIKPDVSAASCVASFTYSPYCFNGTSASSPTAAGAAALIIGAGLTTTPAEVKTYLLSNAAVDRGAPGPDNDFGAGEIVLPQPPACGPGVDSDGDDFDNDIECYLGTDPLDACPDVLGSPGLCPGPSCDGDDAWPPDFDVNAWVNIADVLKFEGRLGTNVGDPGYVRRLDLNTDGPVNIGDVLVFKGRLGQRCTNQ